MPSIAYCEYCRRSIRHEYTFDQMVLRYVVDSAFRRTLIADLRTIERQHPQNCAHPQAQRLLPDEHWWQRSAHPMVDAWKHSMTRVYQQRIRTPAEAEQAEATWRAEDDVKAAGAGPKEFGSTAHDDTPVTADEKLPFIARLFEAFVNLQDIKGDKATKRVTESTDLAIELLCWRILVSYDSNRSPYAST
jgi:hypothetical protein